MFSQTQLCKDLALDALRETVQGGRSVFCTGILFLQTGTWLTKRLKTGKNRSAFDDGSGPAALEFTVFSGALVTSRQKNVSTASRHRSPSVPIVDPIYLGLECLSILEALPFPIQTRSGGESSIVGLVAVALQ